jgi:hypothetical protein
MRLFYQILSIVFVLYCSTIIIRHSSSKPPAVQSFNWIIGKWEGNYLNNKIIENWQFKDKTYKGKGSIYQNGFETFTEDISLIQENNNWYYCPVINGKTIPFLLIQMNESGFIAMNQKNEYPQIIAYHSKNQKQLDAWIAGFSKNTFMKEVFHYSKTIN